jgi:hypothetical protein
MKNNDPSHDLAHVVAVETLVRKVAMSEGWKPGTVRFEAARIVAICHEMCDRKYVEDKERSLANLKTALQQDCIREDISECVLEVVPLISLSRRIQHGTPLLSSSDARDVYLIVSDADYLESLGVVGLVRTHVYRAMHQKSCESAFDHIYNTLLKIPQHLHYDWSKCEGNIRMQRLVYISDMWFDERAQVPEVGEKPHCGVCE